MAIVFNSSPRPTIGVELELQILDPETGKLVCGAPRILEMYPDQKWVKPELIESTIELNTGICETAAEVRKDLGEKLKDLWKTCGKLGYNLAMAGTHPYSSWSEQSITPNERYQKLVDRVQWPARRLMIFGLHVHIGVGSGEKAIAIFNSLTTFIPHLLALSASSPYWMNEDTGMASVRVKVFESLPTAGLPYRLINWAEFTRFMKTLIGAGAITSIREVWWDLRPHPGFGTVEIRVCDGLPTLTEVVSLAAFIQALVVWLGEQYDEGIYLPIHRHWIVRENKWRAARWSTDARIIVDENGGQRLLAEDIEELLTHLIPVARTLKGEEEILGIRDIVRDGPSYSRQRRVFKQTGDLKAVVDSLVTELKENRPTQL
ncbi:MAG: glutamate--cysteine ligase [Candidatus Glassbacteria bacterium]